jgi:hypothetical protein
VLASAGVALLLALGPQVVLGTTTPALPSALPHQLGGFLAYLTSALLLTRRPRAAALACVATAVVHVQIGALVAVVCVLAVAAVRLTERRWWWSTLTGVAVAAAVVVTVLRLRPVAAEPDDFVQICREVIPFHCDVTTWPAGQLGSGFAVVLAALLTAVLIGRGAARPGPDDVPQGPDDVVPVPDGAPGDPAEAGSPARPAPVGARGRPGGLLWAAVVLAPAVGLTAGVVANRYGVPVLGRLAQSTNIFRLAVLVVPLGAWGLIAGFARLSRARRLLWMPPALAAGYGWLEPHGGDTVLAGHSRWVLEVLAVAALAALVALLPRLPGAVRAVPVVAAAAVLGVAVTQVGAVQWRLFRPGFVSDPRLRAMGATIARYVPPGGVVEAPPTWGAIRLTAGRSILVDCKAVPYGGAAWRDYRARMDALGGRGACSHGGMPFTALPPTALISAAQRYGAGYLVLPFWDGRALQLRDAGWRVLARPAKDEGEVWLLTSQP